MVSKAFRKRCGKGQSDLRSSSKPSVQSGERRGREKLPKSFSRIRKPEDMSLEDWQIALRRQFGREQSFKLKNVGASRSSRNSR